MSEGSFDLWQQIFILSMMSNADVGVHGTAAELTNHLALSLWGRFANPGLQDLIGSYWVPSWGPCVSQKLLSITADNAMFVAHDRVNHVYVVAMAGTNFDSLFDIFTEDLKIRPTAWPYGGSAPIGTEIARGTHDGVNVLLTMKSQGQTLLSYLQGRADASISTLIFTGHSLGGALSPTLALALTKQGLNLGDWKAVYVYPTAGPTAGNATFATFFSQSFPQPATGSQPWQVWNADLANRLDIVPRAWNAQTLATIPDLYAPKITTNQLFKGAAAVTVHRVQDYGYTRIGTANDLTGSSVQGSGGEDFAKESLYQHIYAYFELLGIQALLAVTDDRTGAPLFPIRNPYAIAAGAQPPVMASA